MIHPTAKIDRSVQFHGDFWGKLSVGMHSRIDAGCILSVGERGIEIGAYCHISAGVYLYGKDGLISLADCCFLAARTVVYTAMDRMQDDCLVGPTIPEVHRSVSRGDVVLGIGSGTGCGAVLFPGTILGNGAVVGALSIGRGEIYRGDVVVGPKQRVVTIRDYAKIERMAWELCKDAR